ncbi:MAG: hypothetical protein HYY26_05565, partial [Acidobacteria bacterium]|nr:hypothetical protein [Acidobacteriota bacterium]
RRVLDAFVSQPLLLHYLLALFSHSRFLSETLIQQPELILWLGRERHLERIRSKEELLEEYARFETSALDADPSLALARFKRRQYVRITLKDILGLSTLLETTLELSTLADVLLEKALTRAEAELRPRYGTPETLDARGRRVPARFAVVSLGKLGGRELNYSSDIDLLFLFAGEGETSADEAGRRISNAEFFLRLAQRLLQIVAGVTPEGPVFRVDMRLRPGGGEGDLAISLPAALQYYQRAAWEWELQMLLKARHSAGDAATVREFLAGVEPRLYRGAKHFAAVEAVVKAREGFDRQLDAAASERPNVKLAAGGIRDIEFLAQCLQRLYGQDDSWVRAGSTLVALQKLYEKGYLSGRDHFRLASAYEFLRRVEHRLQLEQGQQTHTLPADPEALELLARRCGFASAPGKLARDELLAALEGHLRQVRSIYERTLPRAARVPESDVYALRAPEALAVPGELSYGEILDLLRTQDSPLYHSVKELTVPERAHKALHRFLTAALGSSATFEEVSRAASALPVALEIFRLSEPLTTLLVRRPERLAQLSAIGSAPAGRPEGQLELGWPVGSERELSPALRAVVNSHGSLPRQMAGLRRYFADAAFRWGARELYWRPPLASGLWAYTALAEEVLRGGLAMAEQHSGEAGGEPVDYVVVALGRVGMAEMDWGSDADLIFLAARPEAQLRVRAIAEKLLHVVSGYTREGTLFPVDVRLRPRGSEGELVQTADGVLEYFASSAEVWEAVTYLKARPVGGDFVFGEHWCEQLRAVLRQRFSTPEPIRSSLRVMRQRLEEEGTKNGASSDNFKTGPGGLYDLDFLFSAAALEAGARSQAGCPLAEQASLFADVLAFDAEEREQLGRAARLFRSVDHALRLTTGRSAASLPAGPRLELVAELVGAALGETLSGATLLTSLAETRRAVRELYQRVFG